MSLVRNAASDVGNPAPKTYPDHAATGFKRGLAAYGHHFGDLLRRRTRQSVQRPTVADQPNEGREATTFFDPRNLSQWFRAEVPSETAAQHVRPAPRITPNQRVLVGTSGSAAQARIEISGGSLAGSQIHLTAAGNRIDAQLLTGSEASRQTLVTAMDAVRERLRARGLIVGAATGPGSTDGRRQESTKERTSARPSSRPSPEGSRTRPPTGHAFPDPAGSVSDGDF